MHCLSCDIILTNEEESLTYDNGEPIALCTDCFSQADIYYFNDDDFEGVNE